MSDIQATREGLALHMFKAVVIAENKSGSLTRDYALDLLREIVVAIDGHRPRKPTAAAGPGTPVGGRASKFP